LRAVQAGAEIHEEEAVLSISEIDKVIEVKTNLRVYRCRALIGADGVHGVTAHLWGYTARPADIGLEVHVSDEFAVVKEHLHKLGFYFGAFPDGYTWIFPRRKDASIGLGLPMKQAPRARGLLSDFLASLGLPRELAGKSRGHGIPLFSPLTRRPFCRGNILLAGDAASFVDPITAEGIYYALKSGEEAAGAIIKTLSSSTGAAGAYQNALSSSILPELKAAWKLSIPFYAFQQTTFHAVMNNARLRQLQFDVMVGRRSYQEILTQFPNIISLMKKIISARFDGRKTRL